MDDFDIGDRSNYLRAETLTFGSIEAFALGCALIIFVFFSKRDLISLYIIFLPFTDKVYRFASLQPSDVIAFLLIIKHFKYLISDLKFLYWICPILLVGSIVGLVQFNDSFGFLYSWRLIQTLAAANIILSLIKKQRNIEDYLSLYRRVVYFSLAVMGIQLGSWLLGFPVNGVFYGNGLPRVKGLAHEPSTFSIWLSLSLAFGVNFTKNRKLIINKLYVVVLLVGLVINGSASGFAVAFSFFILVLVNLLYVDRVMFVQLAVSFAIILTVALSSLGPYATRYMIPKVNAFFNELANVETEEISGRGGDRYLAQYIEQYPAFGVGAFRSSRLQSEDEKESLGQNEIISGANFYMSAISEFGLIGGVGLFLIFSSWFIIMYSGFNYSNVFFGFGIITWMVGLTGMRVFAFHQPWFMFVMYMYFIRGQLRNLR